MNTGFLGSAVATVLTVYGIETQQVLQTHCDSLIPLQQYLPFTVLKQREDTDILNEYIELQQYLPFTVLKPK